MKITLPLPWNVARRLRHSCCARINKLHAPLRAALFALILLARSADAATTWNWTGGSGSSDNWSDGSNWDLNTAPDSDLANTDITYFASAALRASSQPNGGSQGFSEVNQPWSIRSLKFDGQRLLPSLRTATSPSASAV